MSYRWQDYKVWDYPSLSLPPQPALWPAMCQCLFSFLQGGFYAPNLGPGFGGAAYKHFSDSDPGNTLYISENNVTGGFLSPSSLTCLVQGCPPNTSPQNTHGPVEKQQLWENTHGGVQHTLLPLWPSAWWSASFHGSWCLHCSSSSYLQGLLLLLHCMHHCQGLSASFAGTAGWSRYYPSFSQKDVLFSDITGMM